MIARRKVALALAGFPLVLASRASWSQHEQVYDSFVQLIYPPIEAIDNPQPFGYERATQAEIDRAKLIIAQTVQGPRPIDIAQSFVDRFFKTAPDLISQWPAPAHWNPLVVEFFSATSYHANNDMIPWCAAFANWCLERAGKRGSRSASSQSFLSKEFTRTNNPKPGDLAVFTVYDNATGRSLGLGHVTFFKNRISDTHITVVGGNQSAGGHSSIISEKPFPIGDVSVKRHVGNNYIRCTMRLNSFVAVA